MEVREGFQKTEVGEIPEDWNVQPLIALVDPSRGVRYGIVQPGKYDQSGRYMIRGQDYSKGWVQPHELFRVSAQIEENFKNARVKTDDILITIVGASTGTVTIVPSWLDGANLTQTTARLAITVGSSLYCQYVLGSWYGKSQVNNYIKGGAQPGLNCCDIEKFIIPLPPTKAEQEAIAEALSDADGLIESLEQLIAKKRQIKQGAMLELLTGKRRLPGFEGEWKSLGLGESATLKARIGWQGLTTAEYRNSGEYYLVTGTEFRNGNVDWSRCHFVSAHRYSQDPYIQIKSNDVLVTKDGTIGKVALVRRLPKPATLNSGVFVIRPKEKAFDPSFFFYLLCSSVFVDFLNQLSAGSTINHLYQKDFVKFVFAVPPKIKEQTAIATILSDMDAEITELEAKLAKARKVKQGMMQELLTGSIRLPLAQGCSELKESANKPKHNQHFEDAVIIGTLAREFGTPQYPVSRKRYTKLSYLLHRYHEQDTSAYLKKAAGPYNPTTRYGGAEKIAQKNGYACQVTGKYKGFVAGENVGQAQEYFLKWYGPDALRWLEQFRYAKSDELELWTTIDAAVQDVLAEGRAETLKNVKAVLQGNKEWVKKLDRPVFSDVNIMRAIQKVNGLFN